MRLKEIKRVALKELGYFTEDYAQEIETYEPEMTVYINQANVEACRRAHVEPTYMEYDETVPAFGPEAYHVLLAYYAAGRILSTDRGEKQQRANQLLSEYYRLLSLIGPDVLRFVHKY